MTDDNGDRVKFPRTIVRGPIEAMLADHTEVRAQHFRGRSSAAPLKRGSPVHGGVAPVFPRTIVRGPIEALDVHLVIGKRCTFPRTIVRGPIEAWRKAVVCGTARNFRGRSSAAPLKP